MSQHLISPYLNELSDLRRVSGEVRELVVREAFKTLLKDWGRSKDLIFVPEYKLDTATRDRRFVDGALLHELRVPFGFWEAKDEEDDLDAEIQKKFRQGYPQDNIVFEDFARGGPDSRTGKRSSAARSMTRGGWKNFSICFSRTNDRKLPSSARRSSNSRKICRRCSPRCAA